MPEASQVPISDVLSGDRFKHIRGKIANLPNGETFRRRVEQDLWQTLVGPDHQEGETVAYEDLPSESRSVIGYVEGGEELPWWLTSFRWRAQSRGEEIALETGQFDDQLANFENFDPSTTELSKPELRDISIVNVLDQFEQLADELGEYLDVAADSTLRLPSNIFTISENRIATTDQFEQWFNDLLEVCPPLNDELTTLLMVNTGVSWEAAEGVVPDDILEQLEALGFEEQRIHNGNYLGPLRRVLELDGVFDLTIPAGQSYEEVGPLEALLYETWAENNLERKEEVADWLDRASEWDPDTLDAGEEPQFARIAFTTPLRLELRKPIYMTLGIYAASSDKSGYYRGIQDGGDQGKRRELEEILASYLE